MFKRLLNRSKDYIFIIPGQEQIWINSLKGKVSCLLYHRIENYGEFDFLDQGGSPVISPDNFDRELKYLKQLPVKFFTLEQLQTGEFPDSQTIGMVICFDDGFKCNYQQGLDVLGKHSIQATFFQCTGFIDQTSLIWEHALYWFFHHKSHRQSFIHKINHDFAHANLTGASLIHNLREQTNPKIIEQTVFELIEQLSVQAEVKNIAQSIYPSSDQVRQVINLGHELASHGHHHYKRENISSELFEQELVHSKSILTQLTNKKPVSFSYPFNDYLPSDHQLVSKYFKNIATVNKKRLDKAFKNNVQIIPRFTWPGRSNNRFRMKRWLLSGSF